MRGNGNPYNRCTEVTPSCPVSLTTYGYIPNKTFNTLYLAIWAILIISQLILGIRFRTWSYSAVIVAGSALEAIGYVGRLQMNNNVWDQGAFEIQVICLIIAPTLLAAGVYLTVKHIVLHYGPQYSRLRPKLYTWIFISCDVTSFAIQALGGGLAGSKNSSTVDIGDSIMIAGIGFQVVTMIICGFITLNFYHRFENGKVNSKHVALNNDKEVQPEITAAQREKTNRRGKLFIIAIGIAYFCILIRCIYRLPEMIGGWGNPRMQEETEFLIFDGLMVLIATIAMTVFHPGWTFPQMMTKRRKAGGR